MVVLITVQFDLYLELKFELCVVEWHLVSVRAFGVMYDHTRFCLQITQTLDPNEMASQPGECRQRLSYFFISPAGSMQVQNIKVGMKHLYEHVNSLFMSSLFCTFIMIIKKVVTILALLYYINELHHNPRQSFYVSSVNINKLLWGNLISYLRR